MRVALIRKKILHQIIMELKIMVHLICHYDCSSRSFGHVMTPFLDLKCPVSLHAQKLGDTIFSKCNHCSIVPFPLEGHNIYYS